MSTVTHTVTLEGGMIKSWNSAPGGIVSSPPNRHEINLVNGLVQSWNIYADGNPYADTTSTVTINNGVVMSWNMSGKWAFQQEVYPSSSYTGVGDNFMYSADPTGNFSTANGLYLQDGKIGFAVNEGVLIKFDLTGLHATISSAKIGFNIYEKKSATGADVDGYFPIYESRRPWTLTGSSYFTWTMAGGFPPQNFWGDPSTPIPGRPYGAQNTTYDIYPTVLGYVKASALGYQETILNASGVSVIQGWINNPATNNGFVIQKYENYPGIPSPITALTILSSNWATKTERPILILS